MMLSEKLAENPNSQSCLGSLRTSTKVDQSFSASNNAVSTINFLLEVSRVYQDCLEKIVQRVVFK